MKAFSFWLLLLVERFYLRTHGWTNEAGDLWSQPDNYPYRNKLRRQGHAVNSQKLHSSMRALEAVDRLDNEREED